jgi:hypothetical protein
MCTTNAICIGHGTRRRSGKKENFLNKILILYHFLFLQEYHLQNALDAQRRLGSAKMRAVPIPDLYEDPNSQSIYPANVELPKQLIRLQRILNNQDLVEFLFFNKFFFSVTT